MFVKLDQSEDRDAISRWGQAGTLVAMASLGRMFPTTTEVLSPKTQYASTPQQHHAMDG